MTHEEGFAVLQSLSPAQYAIVRQAVSDQLSFEYQSFAAANGEESTQGISSSDINHAAVSYIRTGDITISEEGYVVLSEALWRYLNG